MRRTILALVAACESLGHRTLDIGIRIVDAAAWVRDHIDPQRHADAAVHERESMDADREAFDRFMARQEVIVPPPIVITDEERANIKRLVGELEALRAPVAVEPCRCRQVGCPVCDPPCLN